MTVSTITTYSGTVPKRSGQTQSEFSGNVDDLLTYMPTLTADWNTAVGEFNTDIGQFNSDFVDAKAARDAAVAAADYVGEWSAQSGSSPKGISVSHEGATYRLKVDLADISTVEPGVTANWEDTWLFLYAPASIQTFTSSGTWTKPAVGRLAIVEAWGGGGGGNSQTNDTAGGSGGEYVTYSFPLSALGDTETVMVGAGGVGSSAGGNSGSDGGISSFGSHLTARGGLGGIDDGFVTPTPGSAAAADGASVTGSSHKLIVSYSSGYGSDTTVGVGGPSIFGGGGGAAADNEGGTSVFGGDGGRGYDSTAGAHSIDGEAPAGGGGGSRDTEEPGGDGARGEVRVTVI